MNNMPINPLGVNQQNQTKSTNKVSKQTVQNTVNTEHIGSSLDALGNINKAGINFKGNDTKKYAGFEPAFTEAELDDKLKNFTNTIKLVGVDSKEFNNLAEGDKKALKHLVKAAKFIDDAFLKQDNKDNMKIKTALTKASENGDDYAQKMLKMFNSFNGVSGLDRSSTMNYLFKGVENKDGLNYYPNDLGKEEFHSIIKTMLQEGKKEEVQTILNQRSVVVRDGDQLKGIDYTKAFAKEFQAAATELEKAAKQTTNKDMAEYFNLQAEALKKNDPEADCAADAKWASFQEVPLEFTIGREQYADRLTGSVLENPELKTLIEENGIDCQTKDSIGVRVGIINKEGTEDLLGYKESLPAIAKLMPLSDQYEQSISSDPDEEVKQTMGDADIVYLSGDYSACRGGLTVAQNLPNDDKLSVQRGFGRRNIYHRQVRMGGNPEKLQKKLDLILDESLHKLYEKESSHKFTIGHENSHSLGPSGCKNSLGSFSNIIEENKADMGALAFLDYFVEIGKYTQEEADKILVTWAVGNQMKAKPSISQAHRVRSVLQTNYFIEKGAININDEGRMSLNLEKMIPTAKSMLKEVVQLQMSQDPKKAEEFVNKYFDWNPTLEKVAEKISQVDDGLYIALESPLAEELLK